MKDCHASFTMTLANVTQGCRSLGTYFLGGLCSSPPIHQLQATYFGLSEVPSKIMSCIKIRHNKQ